MGKVIDLKGLTFGRLTVVATTGLDRHNRAMWKCACVCGGEVVVVACDLKSGRTASCGCLRREVAGKRNRTHGASRTRLYNIWRGVITRCECPNGGDFPRYGGRGIEVCSEWRTSFPAFRDWAYANGYAPELSIDRENVNGNYEPGNCRWTTMDQQLREHRRDLRPVTQDNRRLFPSIGAASVATGVHRDSIGQAASGRKKTAGGSRWRYADEVDIAILGELKKEMT